MTTSDFSPSGIRVSLHNVDIWQKFYPKNEMIVSRTGRKLFPVLDVNIEGLIPDVLYTVSFYLERVDNIKYTFSTHTGQWEEAGDGKKLLPIDKKPHKDGGMVGAHWMETPVSFSDIHITNLADHEKNSSNNDLILVSSMHKYRPVITVKRLSDWMEEEFRLTMTEFMVVTYYQDREIAELKKALNKYCTKNTCGAKLSRGKKRGISSGTPVSPTKKTPVIPISPVGSPASLAAKKTASSSQRTLCQNQVMTLKTVTPPRSNIQIQMMIPPVMTMKPSTMITPPSMTPTLATPPSQGQLHHQNPVATPPAMAMTPNTMTPTMANPRVQNVMTSAAWDPMYFQNLMMTPPSTTPYPMTQQTMTPPIMQTPPSMTTPSMGSNHFWNSMANLTITTPPYQGSMYNQNSAATPPSLAMTPQNMAPPSMATPLAHDYTMNQFWNPWNVPLMGGGAPMAPSQQQWNMMQAQFGNPGNMQQNNYDFPKYTNYNGAS